MQSKMQLQRRSPAAGVRRIEAHAFRSLYRRQGPSGCTQLHCAYRDRGGRLCKAAPIIRSDSYFRISSRAYLVPTTVAILAAVLIALHLRLVGAVRLLQEGISLLLVGFHCGEAGVFPEDQQVPRPAVVERPEILVRFLEAAFTCASSDFLNEVSKYCSTSGPCPTPS